MCFRSSKDKLLKIGLRENEEKTQRKQTPIKSSGGSRRGSNQNEVRAVGPETY